MDGEVTPEIKVGDELAFNVGYGHRYEIRKVERITPSGRIICGCYTMNPDLKIRGRTGFDGPYRGQIVTDEIREEVRRQKLLSFVKYSMEPDDLTTDQLERIYNIANEEAE